MACRVFVNQMLSGVQQRSLERAWGRPVVDRMGLIIDIFAQRARTKEARLQVGVHARLHALPPQESAVQGAVALCSAPPLLLTHWWFRLQWLWGPCIGLLTPCDMPCKRGPPTTGGAGRRGVQGVPPGARPGCCIRAASRLWRGRPYRGCQRKVSALGAAFPCNCKPRPRVPSDGPAPHMPP